jgi:hypothetical protein
MNITTLLLCTLSALFLTSCATIGQNSGPSSGSKPPEIRPSKTFYLTGEPIWKSIKDAEKFFGNSNSVSITSSKIDLKGNRLSGKKLKHPSNSNDENAQSLKITFDNLHLTNGNIDDMPGGIMLRGNNAQLSKLSFTTRGEDFVSTPKDIVSGVKIESCQFYNGGGDKAIQLNAAKDSEISNCYITGGQTGIRLQESTSKTKDIKCIVRNTIFDQIPTAINIDGYTTLTSSQNKFTKVKQQYKVGPNAKVITK